MDDSLNTVVIVVMTFVIAFVVAKVAPALQKEEKECEPCSGPKWRFLGGIRWLRQEQVIEEKYEDYLPQKEK